MLVLKIFFNINYCIVWYLGIAMKYNKKEGTIIIDNDK